MDTGLASKIAIQIPPIPEEEKTPIVLKLLEIIEQQAREIERLKEEIAYLKKQKTKPKIPRSRLEKDIEEENKTKNKKRPGSKKRKKTKEIEIHETRQIPPEHIPEGSTFKGYQDFVVQDIEIKAHNVRYRLERWETPEGDAIIGKLPESVQTSHFGTTLVSFILYQYFQCHVTQPLLLEELREWGIDISSGQLNRILTENKEDFHEEKEEILSVALKISNYIQVDDTGARHQGKNGYCTHIGNEFFAWFQSTHSKSRINFLELLRAGNQDYVFNEDALEYIKQRSFPKELLTRLEEHESKMFADKTQWEQHLESLGITRPRHIQIATEATLLGSILSHGVSKNLGVVSDDAGQFNILEHALCWIHVERSINKIIPYTDQGREDLEKVRDQIWKFYQDLKSYKKEPTENKKDELEKRFDDIFTQKTSDPILNMALQHILSNKDEMLLVLERPEIPLHNNLSERDIREYVKRRKISGGTRSELGRQARDTFTSLKKTCRKLEVSFWNYLNDRISKSNIIPSLPELILLQAHESG